MTILDTNVVSALMSDPPDASVVGWIDQQPSSSVWTSAITVLEIQTGLRTMPSGKRQIRLSQVFERILDGLNHRIAVFDEEAARLASDLSAARQKKGRVVEIRDTMIAGIVLAHRATLATRNVSHFADISAKVVNPWKD
jgi:toxin FitB